MHIIPRHAVELNSWKKKSTKFQTNVDGSFKLDSTGEKMVESYQRFIPDLNQETFLAVGYIVIGIVIVLGLEWYGKKTRQIQV